MVWWLLHAAIPSSCLLKTPWVPWEFLLFSSLMKKIKYQDQVDLHARLWNLKVKVTSWNTYIAKSKNKAHFHVHKWFSRQSKIKWTAIKNHYVCTYSSKKKKEKKRKKEKKDTEHPGTECLSTDQNLSKEVINYLHKPDFASDSWIVLGAKNSKSRDDRDDSDAVSDTLSFTSIKTNIVAN